MALVQLSDVYNQAVMASYQIEDPVFKTAFFESGVIATNSIINELAASPSNEINIPYWKAIDSSIEPNYSDDVYEDVAVPRNIATGVMKARTAYLNEGFSSAHLVMELTKQDPLKYVAAKLDRYWMEQSQRRIIASAVGLYNDNKDANASDMIIDVSVATGTPADVNKFSAGAFIDAEATMGDHIDGLGAICMHRAVYSTLQKQNVILFIPSSDAKTTIATYQGRRVIVDNSMPVIGGTGLAKQYLSIIFNDGAIGYGLQLPHNSLRFYESESRGNGGGVETLWTRRNMILHPQGYQFTSAVITGNGTETAGQAKSASWADLADKTNWTRVFNRQNVGIAFLVTNA